MKRQIIWAATAGIALAGCTHVECPGIENAQTTEATQSEITVNPFNRKMSRGIVEKTKLKDKGSSASRIFYMSAYNATEGTDYFINKTFGERLNDATPPTGTGVWGAVKLSTTGTGDLKWDTDAVYWPFGVKLDFLAYSQSYNEADGTHPCPKIFANWKSANEVELEVTQNSKLDDILYAAANGLNSSNSNSTIGFSMTFNHAQAWLTFRLKLTEGSAPDALTINSIKCANIYSGGKLTLKNEGDGNASADWHFFPLAPSDVAVDDVTADAPSEKVFGNPLTTTAKDLDILLPPQDHNGFIINYTLSGRTCNLRIPVDQLKSSIGKWEAGTHYTYYLNFTLNEITVAPYVTAWESTSDGWEETNKYVEKLKNVGAWITGNYLDYGNYFASPTISDNAHLGIKTQSDKYPTDIEYIALLNKILDGLRSSDVEPTTLKVGRIKYKGAEYTYYETGSYWRTGEETISLGKKICEEMMKTGFYTAILTLDDEQTIEIHLNEINLYYAKLHHAMQQTLANRNAADDGSPLKKLTSIAYDTANNTYSFTFSSDIGSESDSQVIDVLWNFFRHLGVSTIAPASLLVQKVIYNSENYLWNEVNKTFGTGNRNDTSHDLGTILQKLCSETSEEVSLSLDGIYGFKIKLIKGGS